VQPLLDRRSQIDRRTAGGFQLAGGGNQYQLGVVVDPTQPFVISVRARVLQEETIEPGNHNGFSFGVFTGTEEYGLGLGPNGYSFASGPGLKTFLPATIDNTADHTYVLAVTPGVSFQLFRDSVLIATGTPQPYNSQAYLVLGDSTGGTNAEAYVRAFTFAQPATVGPFVSLPPGGLTFLSGTTVVEHPELAGTALEDSLIPFTITNASGTLVYRGTIQNRVVWSNILGTLIFSYRIRDTDATLGGSVIGVSRTGFRQGTTFFNTEVDFRLDGLGSIGPSGASRNGSGNQIDFAFANNPVTAGAESFFVEVMTNATHYDAVGSLTVYTSDGSDSGPLTVFAPVAP
jgi:hypothetical protein